MKLKPVMKYQLHLNFQIFRIMYLVIYVITFATIAGRYFSNTGGNVSGMEFATIITIFVTGLTTFKDSFRFFTSSGVSRKSFFLGLLSSFGITALATALIDCINMVIFSLFLNYGSAYLAICDPSYVGIQMKIEGTNGILNKIIYTPEILLKSFLWCAMAYFAVAMIGLFITMLYYRMNRTQKILVSVGVPSFFFILLPILNQYAAGGWIGKVFISLFHWWIACSANPAADIATRLALAAIFVGVTYCMVRKADVKA